MLRTGAHGKANVNRDNREGEPGRIAWMGVIPVPINANDDNDDESPQFESELEKYEVSCIS